MKEYVSIYSMTLKPGILNFKRLMPYLNTGHISLNDGSPRASLNKYNSRNCWL